MIEKLKRRLIRLKKQKDDLERKHQGNELKYTYWAGYDLGYLKGKICEIEEIIDELELKENNSTLIDIEKATKEELLLEYEKCEGLWSKNSSDCFGYYISALHKRIVELGGWSTK